jgi:glycine dehydrogenase
MTDRSTFADRHIGPAEDELAKMLAVVGYGSLDELTDDAVPDAIRASVALDIGAPVSEAAAL